MGKPVTRTPWRLVLGALLLTSSQAPAAHGRPFKVTVGVRNRVYDLVYDIGLEKGCFRQQGVEVGQVVVRGNIRDVMNALANGVVDATRSIFFASLERERWRGMGFKIVAETDQEERGKPVFSYYLVRKDLAGRVKTFADLRGRVLMGHTPEGLEHLRFLKRLEEAGVSISDITIKPFKDSIAAAAMANARIDLGYYKEPVAGKLVALGRAEVFAGSNIASETAPAGLLYFSRRLLLDPERGERFLAGELCALREYARAPRKALEALALKRFGERPPKDLPLDGIRIRPDAGIDTRYLLELNDYAFRKGLVRSKLDEKDAFDPSPLERARLRRVGVATGAQR